MNKMSAVACLQDTSFEFEWTIQDFDTIVDISKKCGSDKAMQIDMEYRQKPYVDLSLSKDAMELHNRWKCFLRKPKGNGSDSTTLWKFGVKRTVNNFQEEHDFENPFGIKVSFRIDREEGSPPILVESDMFYLKNGETKKFEAASTQELLQASDFEMLTVLVKLEILANSWQSLNRLLQMEETAFMKEEVQETRVALSTFYNQSDLPFADFTLRVPHDYDDGYETFPVNKCIIGAMSPVFKRMFENPMFIEGKDAFVTIIDLSAKAVHHLLQFVYGGDLILSSNYDDRDANAEVIMQLVNAADKYQLPSLKNTCDEELPRFFTPANAYEMLDLCSLHDLRSSHKIEEYCDINIGDILKERKKQIQSRVKFTQTSYEHFETS